MTEPKNTYTDGDDLLTDLVEKSPEYRKVIKEVEAEVEKIMEAKGIHGMGSCHTFWDLKKEILKKKHGISWRTPTDLNPGTLFD